MILCSNELSVKENIILLLYVLIIIFISMKWRLGILLLLTCGLLGCGIRGEIVPVRTKHSYQGEFQFTKYSHAIIRLYVERSSESNDVISTHRIHPVTEFPIKFSVPFPSGVDAETLKISAKVLSGPDDEAKVGDFITETVTPVKRGSLTIIEVVGLESCNAPNKGGFCSDDESN